MILGEQLYKLVRNEMVKTNIRFYSDYIPDKTSYPFVMFEIDNQEAYPDTAFEKDYERLRVRFNIYDNSDNPHVAIGIGEEIETIFDRTKLQFSDLTEGKWNVCNVKVNDDITYLNEDHFWLLRTDYEFVCQRDL